MNKARRKELNRAVELLEEAKDIIEICKDEEMEYLENIPENLQNSEKYEMADSAVYALERACESVDEAIDSVEEASE